MSRNYYYDHSGISLALLHSIGIRKISDLEEVIEGESYWQNAEEDVKIATGFNADMRAIVVAFKIQDLTITTIDARVASVEEIKSDFCKYCL